MDVDEQADNASAATRRTAPERVRDAREPIMPWQTPPTMPLYRSRRKFSGRSPLSLDPTSAELSQPTSCFGERIVRGIFLGQPIVERQLLTVEVLVRHERLRAVGQDFLAQRP